MTTKGFLNTKLSSPLACTKLCNSYWIDDCFRGDNCAFAHSLEELRPLPPRLTKASFQFYDGENVPNAEDVVAVLSWGMKYYRNENVEVPKWVNDLVWDFCVPNFLTWVEQLMALEAAGDLMEGEQGWRLQMRQVGERSHRPFEPSEEANLLKKEANLPKKVKQEEEELEEEPSEEDEAMDEEESCVEEEPCEGEEEEAEVRDAEEEEPCEECANLQGEVFEEEEEEEAMDEEEHPNPHLCQQHPKRTGPAASKGFVQQLLKEEAMDEEEEGLQRVAGSSHGSKRTGPAASKGLLVQQLLKDHPQARKGVRPSSSF